MIESDHPFVAVTAGIRAHGTGGSAVVAALTARRRRATEPVERWATAIGPAQLEDDRMGGGS